MDGVDLTAAQMEVRGLPCVREAVLGPHPRSLGQALSSVSSGSHVTVRCRGCLSARHDVTSAVLCHATLCAVQYNVGFACGQ
jgi:hypothetical protein